MTHGLFQYSAHESKHTNVLSVTITRCSLSVIVLKLISLLLFRWKRVIEEENGNDQQEDGPAVISSPSKEEDLSSFVRCLCISVAMKLMNHKI